MPETKKKGDVALPRILSKTKCPFLGDPFEECLCSDMRSMNISAVIRLCGGDFEACVIYMNAVKKTAKDPS